MLADLHVHTHLSVDGIMPPERIVARALQRGLGLIAVTDHDAVGGGRLTREAASGTGLAVVVGAEVTTDAGHIQGLGLKDDVLPAAPRPLPWRLAVDGIHAQGGLAVWAHPFRSDRPLDAAVLECVDGIEVFNGRVRWSRFVAANDRAIWTWRSAGGPLLPTAGSDAHCPPEVGAVALEGPDLGAGAALGGAELRRWLACAHRAWACRPSALCQTHSQLRKAARTRDPAMAVRAVARAAFRLGESLSPPSARRAVVWSREEGER